MLIAVVYESLFGNTHEIADAIADGLRAADPTADVTCQRVPDFDPDLAATLDLLVVGGPTHIRGMTSHLSRKMGLESEQKNAEDFHPEPDAIGPGVRDLLHTLPKAPRGSRVAAFDTRIDARLAGGAAHGIARRLQRHGYELAAEPTGFIVTDTEGPLGPGEIERARTWAAGLLRQPVS